MLTRVITELKEALAPEDTDELPSKFNDLCEMFGDWLGRVPKNRPLLLMLDAIDQISAPNLRWIPTTLPAHITCVMSALPSEQEKWLQTRDAELYQVPALDLEARHAVTEGYLARYRKKLSPDQLNRVVSAEPCESPLFLMTVLAELVIFGSFERLYAYIDHLVTSEDLGELFERMITRFEEDYGAELTKSVLTALWASRTGLSEDELVGITDFPLVEISKITLALDQHLKESGGLIQFTHSFLEEAVCDQYLSEQEARQDRHRELASWFRAHNSGWRGINMLIFQNRLARDWSQLHIDLTDHELGVEAVRYVSNRSLFTSWSKIHEHLDLTIEDEYERVWRDDGDGWRETKIEEWILSLLSYAGRATEFQVMLGERELKHKRLSAEQLGTPEGLRDLSISLNHAGDILKVRGSLDDALSAYQEALEIDRRLIEQLDTPESLRALGISLHQVGDISKARGAIDEALSAYQEALEIDRHLAEQLGTPESLRRLSVSLNQIGDVLKVRGAIDEALSAYREGLDIRRHLVEQLGTLESFRDLSLSLDKVGNILEAKGTLDKALFVYQESLENRRYLVQRLRIPRSFRDLWISLNKIGNILAIKGELVEALVAFQEGLEICRRLVKNLETLESFSDLSRALDQIGSISEERGELDDALSFYQEGLEIRRSLVKQLDTPESFRDLSRSFGQVGNISKARGELDDALSAYQEGLEIRKSLVKQLDTPESLSDLSRSLSQVGDISEARGELDDALSAYQESLEIQRRLVKQFETPQSLHVLSRSLNRVGNIFETQGVLNEALFAYEEALEIDRNAVQQFGTPKSNGNLSVSLNNIGDALRARGIFDEAFSAYQEGLEIRRHLVEHLSTPQSYSSLIASLFKVGDMFETQGALDEAFSTYQESLAISRRLVEQLGAPQNYSSLIASLFRVGDIFATQGALDEARSNYQEGLEISRRLVKQLGTPESLRDLSVSLNKVGSISESKGALDEALSSYEEGLEISRDLVRQLGTPESLRDLCASLHKVGGISETRGGLDEARSNYQEGLEISRRLVKQLGTPESLCDLSVSLNSLGCILETQGALDEAFSAYQEGLEISRRLVEQLGTPESQRHLSASLNRVGSRFETQGVFEEVLSVYHEMLEISRHLAKQQGTLESFRNLSISLEKVGDIFKAKAELDNALSHYQEVLDRGELLTQQSDLYSLGVVLEECLGDSHDQQLIQMIEHLQSRRPTERGSAPHIVSELSGLVLEPHLHEQLRERVSQHVLSDVEHNRKRQILNQLVTYTLQYLQREISQGELRRHVKLSLDKDLRPHELPVEVVRATFRSGDLFAKQVVKITLRERFIKGPSHLKPYLMLETPVTQSLFFNVTGDQPSFFSLSILDRIDQLESYKRSRMPLENMLPVEQVSREAATSFCNQLSQLYSLDPAYKLVSGVLTLDVRSDGFRLPNEAEWEFAARGDIRSNFAGSNNLDRVGWYRSNAKGRTHRVKEKWKNPFGLYDMSGNVWELCENSYSPEGSTSGPQRNYRVCRGGSVHTTRSNCGIEARVAYKNQAHRFIGFRVVRSLGKS